MVPRSRPSALLLFLCLCLTLGGAACATGGSGGDDGPRRNANRITADELAEFGTYNALEAIRRLRPRWLQPRGSTAGGANLPVAILDGARLGDPQALSTVNVADIESMQFLNASDATMRYGTNFPGGAIEVKSRAN